MKVAIVHDFLQNLGGAEKVVMALSELFPDAPIYTLVYDKKMDEYFAGKNIITSYLQKFTFIPSRFFIGLFPYAIESFDFSGYDLVISSSNSYAKNIITPTDTLHISYIHSPMRYAWDTTHFYLADQAHRTPIGNAFGLVQLVAGSIIRKLRIWDFVGADRVDVFVANSKNVAARIKKYYRRDSIVIYPPVEVQKITPTPENRGYYLVLSRLVSYKRADLAVEAANRLKLPLVVIGTGEEEAELKQLAGDTVRIIGWVTDSEKYEYLKNCKALIFAGEEDLGIVPVEAMAAGKPVIAYKKGGLLETVVENETGIFFEEQTVESLMDAIQKLESNYSSFNYQTISDHAANFSKEKFFDQIKKLVDEKMLKHE